MTLTIFVMTDFDVNKELEIIKLKENLEYLFINEFEFEYFYHGHRLGTRVPLFIILSDSEYWEEESIVYFCKIGNVMSFKFIRKLFKLNSLIDLLAKLLRRYGSNYCILLYYGENSQLTTQLLESIITIAFLNSEINYFVQISENSNSLTDNSKSLIVIQIQRVKDSDLQNALILERLQRDLKLQCLDWAWQYEQSDKLFLFSKLVFKNLVKWKNIKSCGEIVEGTCLVPMKLMRDDDEEHSPDHVLSQFSNIGMIIDLSNDEGSYDKKKFTKKGIEYKRIQIESKVIPSSTDVFEFIQMVKCFSSTNKDKQIIVHCHYGYNRTGLMICAYLIEEKHVSVHEALKRFKDARPPGIKHQNYIDKLILRYSEQKSNNE